MNEVGLYIRMRPKPTVFVFGAAGPAADGLMEMPLQVPAHLAVATWLRSSLERALYSQALRTQR